jgi:predicted Zn finger-like uncharacterized protein
MIIQCEQCKAKFRLDDSKVTDRGVKVRCAKCRNVFTVTREQPEAAPPDFASSLEPTDTGAQAEELLSAPFPQSEVQEPTNVFTVSPDLTEEAVDSKESYTFETMDPDLTLSATKDNEFNISSPEGEEGLPVERHESPSYQEEVDFDSFDFAGSGSEADSTTVESPSAEEPADAISFDSGTGSAADSAGRSDGEAGQKSSSLLPDSDADVPFSLGEIDFGDGITSVPVQQVKPSEMKPSREMISAPPAEALEKSEPITDDQLKKIFLVDAGRAEKGDVPPLSIASRRKQSPLFTGLMAAVALVALGVLGYFGFSYFSDDKGKVSQEAGKISVRGIKASYVKNSSAGTLLVISGEAVNEYQEPRAALQVKGIIFDAKGQILSSKSAFGGNLFTDEQLSSLPLDKIEAAMANRFGDSLTNLEVAPGRPVSFMIVIAKPPKEGKDFGVEPAGSTAAKGKQQQ